MKDQLIDSGLTGTSSKLIQSDSLRVAVTLDDSTENTEPSNSRVRLDNPPSGGLSMTSSFLPSVASNRQSRTSIGKPFMMTVTLSNVLDFFHIENFSNASNEEAMFLQMLHFQMHANAKTLAKEANGTCDRIYDAFMAAMILNAEKVSYWHEAEGDNDGAEVEKGRQESTVRGESCE